MATRQWTLSQMLRQYGVIVARKMGFIAIAWVVVYFLSQKTRVDGSMAMLFAPLLGAPVGLIAGWYMAERSVEDSSMSGIVLWIILVFGAVAPMWIVEGIMHVIKPTWPMNFGGFMLLTASTLMALAAAVWHASSQE